MVVWRLLMLGKMIGVFLKSIPKPFFSSLGFAWLLFKVVDYFSGSTNILPGWMFPAVVVVGTLGTTIYDGLFGRGFLRKSVSISSNSFDTKIKVLFGDIFKQEGWRVIAVNDFFDSIVDGHHIAPNTLHGQMLSNYWGGNTADWDAQIENAIGDYHHEEVDRPTGKRKRFSLGTTARTSIKSDQFLCVALGATNTELEVHATSEEFLLATKKMLRKARSFCSGEPLSIPIMGSGLLRIGVKFNILVHLILLAVFEETKKSKITNEIRIVIYDGDYSNIDILALEKEWK